MKWAKRDLQRLPLEGEEIQVSLNFTEDEIPFQENEETKDSKFVSLKEIFKSLTSNIFSLSAIITSPS